MKRFEVTIHEEPFINGGTLRARFVVHGGLPSKRLTPLAMGVPEGVPVVLITQETGDDRTRSGTQLQGVRPETARQLAWALMEAADAAEEQ